MKTCYECKEEKELSCFHKKSFNKDGYSGLCIDCEKKRWHKWYINNSARVKNNVKRHYNNSEEYRLKHRAYSKRWADNNKELRKQLNKAWVELNRERFLAKKREWRKNNPHKATEYNHARRARKLMSGGDLNARQIVELKLSNPECAICGSKKNLEVDHIIPLSTGGRNDINNIQILCYSCNRSKGVSIISGAGTVKKFRMAAKRSAL